MLFCYFQALQGQNKCEGCKRCICTGSKGITVSTKHEGKGKKT